MRCAFWRPRAVLIFPAKKKQGRQLLRTKRVEEINLRRTWQVQVARQKKWVLDRDPPGRFPRWDISPDPVSLDFPFSFLGHISPFFFPFGHISPFFLPLLSHFLLFLPLWSHFPLFLPLWSHFPFFSSSSVTFPPFSSPLVTFPPFSSPLVTFPLFFFLFCHISSFFLPLWSCNKNRSIVNQTRTAPVYICRSKREKKVGREELGSCAVVIQSGTHS